MAEHPNAALVRQALDSMSRGDTQGIADALSDDVEWHEIGRAEPIRGKAALAERFGGSTEDYQITAEMHDVVANDEHVIALVEATGNRGGKSLTYRTAEIFHIRDGKITARWAFSDDTARITEFFA
ncbi:MAG: nuclear transport factor 2 family protein [Chloroflexota bacterium]|nr:nuclear transport factor 2 family protein [Chloroflexota bacterium]